MRVYYHQKERAHLLGLTSDIEPAVIFAQIYLPASFGIIFGYARARDYSMMIPIMVHIVFNFITLGSARKYLFK
jgi:membrane protease YdiL (CAAX protease family)